jgi:flagellar biosynthetic protein FlhB
MMMMMADEDKQFDASPQKLQRAREEGQIPKSQDLGSAVVLAVGLFLLLALAPSIWKEFCVLFALMFGTIATGSIDEIGGIYLLTATVKSIAMTMGPFLIAAMFAGVISQAIQVGVVFTTKPLMPKFDRLNPANGFKQLFSMQKVIDLAKNIIKISLLSLLGFNLFKEFLPQLLDSGRSGHVLAPLLVLGTMLQKFIMMVAIAFFVIGAADYLYQKFKFMKDQKMSHKEVKDEYKQSEGDPHVKHAIKQRRMEMAQRRMLDAVAQAEVVVTNPIHVAVALGYQHEHMEAPVVLAKGTAAFAQHIKAMATRHGVPILEDPPVARALYQLVGVQEEVTPELYQPVAQLLTQAWSSVGKAPPQLRPATTTPPVLTPTAPSLGTLPGTTPPVSPRFGGQRPPMGAGNPTPVGGNTPSGSLRI